MVVTNATVGDAAFVARHIKPAPPDPPFAPRFDPSDPEEVATALLAMVRFDREVAPDFSPGYSPHLIVDEFVWRRIRHRFHWFEKGRVFELGAAPDEALIALSGGLSAASAICMRIGRQFRLAREHVSDVYGRPDLAIWEAAMRAVDKPLSWLPCVRRAARDVLSKRWPVEFEALRPVVPQHWQLMKQNIFVLRSQLRDSWHAAGRPMTNLNELFDRCESIGVFKPSKANKYVWAPVWKYALTCGS